MPDRKPKADTTAGKVAAFQAVTKQIEVPAHVQLRAGDLPFWDAILSARSRESWNACDLVSAGNLARAMADIERLQLEINDEGDLAGKAVNPKHALLEVLSRRVVTLAKMIHVAPHARPNISRDTRITKAAEAQAEATLQKANDRLIPKNTLQ